MLKQRQNQLNMHNYDSRINMGSAVSIPVPEDFSTRPSPYRQLIPSLHSEIDRLQYILFAIKSHTHQQYSL